jgi:membrane protease YdiL (CAAX protease family)
VTSLRDLLDRATVGPAYPPDDRDLGDIRVAGLAFPSRASVAVLAATAIIVADRLGMFVSGNAATGPARIGGLEAVTIERLVLFLLVPLAVITLGFRDRPSRYALQLGDWRWGSALLVAGLIVMTPIILALASLPEFRAFYGTNPLPVGERLLNNLAELIPAEFLLRGFLMFALWRRIGALALVVVQVPFVLTHIGKPEVELWSTFVGGTVFAWLDWRTGSILWSALGHVYVLTLMVAAVGGATL